jgi:DtxR family transcriptional regulator, Mn-dependent transcriptional regulator
MAALEAQRSAAVEDYAKAIYSISERSDDGASISAIAERLGVAPASASAMVTRLGELGLVRHERYRGVHLTASGKRIALEVMRHHRLLELYLAEALGMPWDRVHDEAEILEHALSAEVSDLIAAKLGDPSLDPHGDPIPSRDGTVEQNPTVSLQSAEPGATGVFTRVSDSNPELLRLLSKKGIAPGMRFKVVDKDPLDGPLYVRFGNHVHPLAGTATRTMRVELDRNHE